MNTLEKNKNYLKILSLADKKLLKNILKHSNKKQIYCLCEIVLNLLSGNINLEKSDFEKLQFQKTNLRRLLNKSKLSDKKFILQKGGFLEIIIPTVISALASIVTDLLK